MADSIDVAGTESQEDVPRLGLSLEYRGDPVKTLHKPGRRPSPFDTVGHPGGQADLIVARRFAGRKHGADQHAVCERQAADKLAEERPRS